MCFLVSDLIPWFSRSTSVLAFKDMFGLWGCFAAGPLCSIFSVFLHPSMGGGRIPPFTHFSSNYMLHMELKRNLLGTEKLFYFCCLCWQKPKPRLCYLLPDEWSLSNNYSSRIWALGDCKVESLWHGIESGLIHVFICLMFLGFPVEGGLGREWMMAA